MLAFLYLQTHGNRFQSGHAFRQLLRSYSQIQSGSRNSQRALNGGLIAERQLVGRQQLLTTPPYFLAFEAYATNATADKIVVGIINQHLGIVKQFQLLHTFLLQGTEVLLMGRTDGCQHTNRRLYNVMQGIHLSQLADACLKKSYLRLVVEQPD